MTVPRRPSVRASRTGATLGADAPLARETLADRLAARLAAGVERGVQGDVAAGIGEGPQAELPALALVLARLSAAPEAKPGRLVGATVLVGMAGAAGLVLSATMLPGALPGLSAGAGAALSAGLLLLALCATALRGLGGQMILGWGVALLLHVGFAASGADHGYDARLLAARLAPAAEAGLAYYGDSYNGEVNFSLRLRQPVATPGDPAALTDWAQHHPDGLIFGPLTGAALKEPPAETVRFNGRDLGIWRAGSALSVPG